MSILTINQTPVKFSETSSPYHPHDINFVSTDRKIVSNLFHPDSLYSLLQFRGLVSDDISVLKNSVLGLQCR